MGKYMYGLIGSALLLATWSGSVVAGEKTSVADSVQVTATVVSVDKETREIKLKGPEGKVMAVVAGPEVANFDQIAKGDQVNIQYYQALAAEIMEPGAAPSVTVKGEAARAAPGSKPGVSGRQDITMTVKIDTVDVENNTVTFTDPEGVTHVVMPERPQGKAFIKKLKPGDDVAITFTEALAISVEPAAKK